MTQKLVGTSCFSPDMILVAFTSSPLPYGWLVCWTGSDYISRILAQLSSRHLVVFPSTLYAPSSIQQASQEIDHSCIIAPCLFKNEKTSCKYVQVISDLERWAGYLPGLSQNVNDYTPQSHVV